MGYNSSNRSASPRQGSSLLIGILLGMVLGLAVAGGVAWYLQQSRGTLTAPEKPEPEKSLPAIPSPASGVSEAKPRFEFYKVLTDKQDTASTTQKDNGKTSASAGKAATEQALPGLIKEIYYLQAGSFSNAEDADKLKAKLAMLGMEANVQIATIPDKGIWHRVRLGPYKGAEEMNQARATLKQNGIEGAPMRSQ